MRPTSSNFRYLPRLVHWRYLASSLVCALLLAQWLGLVHSIVHGPESAQPRAASAARPVAAINAAGTSDNLSRLADLFALHDDAADCRLFDQAAHDGAAPAFQTLALPVVWGHRVFDISHGKALARWAALFDARGPPPLA